MLRALELVRARAAMMSGEPPAFNELLTAAYMEKQSMGFHTDGERGLGPIVASLSMGSPAIMKFRTLEDRKTIVLSLVLRHVCLFIFNLHGSITHTGIYRESKLQSPPNAVKFPDDSPSVVVMEGAMIQAVYE